jgi:hypothetical protein
VNQRHPKCNQNKEGSSSAITGPNLITSHLHGLQLPPSFRAPEATCWAHDSRVGKKKGDLGLNHVENKFKIIAPSDQTECRLLWRNGKGYGAVMFISDLVAVSFFFLLQKFFHALSSISVLFTAKYDSESNTTVNRASSIRRKIV